jgi:hypothetical protein
MLAVIWTLFLRGLDLNTACHFLISCQHVAQELDLELEWNAGMYYNDRSTTPRFPSARGNADAARSPKSPCTSRSIFSAFRARIFDMSSCRDVVSAVSTCRGFSCHGNCIANKLLTRDEIIERSIRTGRYCETASQYTGHSVEIKNRLYAGTHMQVK